MLTPEHRIHPRLATRGAIALIVSGLIFGGLAVWLTRAQSREREQSQERLADRAQLAAGLTKALFVATSTQHQLQATDELGGAPVKWGDLASFTGSARPAYVAVVGPGGKVLGATIGTPAAVMRRASGLRPGSPSIPTGAWGLREGADGGVLLQLVTAFPGRNEPRALVEGIRAQTVIPALSAAFEGLPNPGSTQTAITDSDGRVLADLGDQQDPKAGEERAQATAPIPGSPLRIKLTARQTALGGGPGALAWILYGLLLVSTLAGAALLLRARRGERSLHFAEDRFRHAFEDAPIGVALVDDDGHVLEVNDQLSVLLGRPAKQLVGRGLDDVLGPAPKGEPVTEVVRPDNSTVYLRVAVARSESATIVHVVDMTESHRLQTSLRALADQDELTGLANRRKLADHAEVGLARAQRTRRPLALVALDLDGFKEINDSFGHQVGDSVLREVAQRLSREVRRGDLLVRYGGDEFVVLMPDLDANSTIIAQNRVDEMVERLRACLAAPLRVSGSAFELSISAGTALFPRDGIELHELVAVADTRMYEAKQTRHAPAPVRLRSVQ